MFTSTKRLVTKRKFKREYTIASSLGYANGGVSQLVTWSKRIESQIECYYITGCSSFLNDHFFQKIITITTHVLLMYMTSREAPDRRYKCNKK